MRKRLSVSIVCLVALLSMIFLPTLIADARSRHHHGRQPAYGTWVYVPSVLYEWTHDDYIARLGHEDADWTGTFTGTSYDAFLVAIDPSGTTTCPYGLICFDGNVDDKEGSLVISFSPGEKIEGVWYGSWEIISGTGELENLSGQGKWWGSQHHLEYKGWIRFKDYKHDDYDDD